jgi:hypothetical protein
MPTECVCEVLARDGSGVLLRGVRGDLRRVEAAPGGREDWRLTLHLTGESPLEGSGEYVVSFESGRSGRFIVESVEAIGGGAIVQLGIHGRLS